MNPTKPWKVCYFKRVINKNSRKTNVRSVKINFNTFYPVTMHPDTSSTSSSATWVVAFTSICRNLSIYLNDIGDIKPNNPTTSSRFISSTWASESDRFVEVPISSSDNSTVVASPSSSTTACPWGTIDVRGTNTWVYDTMEAWSLGMRPKNKR